MDDLQISSLLRQYSKLRRAAGDMAWAQMSPLDRASTGRYPCEIHLHEDDDRKITVTFERYEENGGGSLEVHVAFEDLQGI